MRVKMWGVRGSIPTPGPTTVGVGGNTSCYEVRAGDTLIVLDGGTGLRMLGQELLTQMPLEAWVFFSHVHWDFPVHLSEMGATMDFHTVYEGEVVTIGPKQDVRVENARGNHPNGVYAYRIEHDGKAVVYVTDSEHYSIVDPKLKKLARDADVLIFDAMYTPEEYAGTSGGSPKTGWGHATYVAGCELAAAAGVKQLVLHHHDPNQTDDMVAEKERRARELFPNTIAAREGTVLDL